ncbi:uncharacterized protein TNCV_1505891 [Trichonephila clavipes]|nr:uncharacterized protein TNCV_1505891 [Trichonephila clavipes]
MFKNCCKEDLRIVALEFGETVVEKVTIAESTEIIKENKYFKEDVEFVKELIQYTIENRKKAEEEHKKAEETRLREKELELELARLNVRVNSDNERTGEGCNSLDALVKSVRILKVKVPNRPEEAPVVMSDCYMDDILSGSESIEEEYALLESDETKALGIIWNPKLDCFIFRIEQQKLTSFTKRMVLSTIARIFDTLGLLGPIITWAKIFMQRLWLLELEWSDELPFKDEKEWRRFIDSSEAVNNISIDRCIVIHRAESIELHAFSDASEKANG